MAGLKFDFRSDCLQVLCLLHYSNLTDENLETERFHCLDDHAGSHVRFSDPMASGESGVRSR